MKLLQPNDESLFYVRYFQYIPVPRKLYKSSLEKFKENLKEAEGISKDAHSMMDRIKKVDQIEKGRKVLTRTEKSIIVIWKLY